MSDKIVVLGENERHQLVRLRDNVYVRPKNVPAPDRQAGRWECSWRHFQSNRDAYTTTGHNYWLMPEAFDSRDDYVAHVNATRTVEEWDALVAEFLAEEQSEILTEEGS